MTVFEDIQTLGTCFAMVAAFPDSVKQTLWETAKLDSPADPIGAYITNAAKYKQFLDELMANLK
jgi:hypothetical protein